VTKNQYVSERLSEYFDVHIDLEEPNFGITDEDLFILKLNSTSDEFLERYRLYTNEYFDTHGGISQWLGH
jgi:hypothetical protein